jgi:hypothetical protein
LSVLFWNIRHVSLTTPLWHISTLKVKAIRSSRNVSKHLQDHTTSQHFDVPWII